MSVIFVDDIDSANALSGVTQCAARQGGRVVLVGHEPGTNPQRRNWARLPFPFTRHDVEKLLSCEPVI